MQHGFHLTVTGKVQGVGYRRWFAQLAQAKGLRGYVKNLSTGEVEAVIIGLSHTLQEVLEQSLIGPSQAKVIALDYRSCSAYGYHDFQILR